MSSRRSSRATRTSTSTRTTGSILRTPDPATSPEERSEARPSEEVLEPFGEQVGASDVPPDVGATDRQAPEGIVDRADERPAADVGRLELQLVREPAHDRIDGAQVESFGQQRPKEVTRVERSFARERLGIDHEPGFAVGGEHVP